ncbi:MAG: type I methionyl aminopeptidase [bacterium]|nr:type I methionyl aminopeptidase [bacterium]
MISLKSKKDIGEMREGGAILARILARVSSAAKPGVTTQELDELTKELTRKAGAETAFLGYQDFPGAVCTAVNEEGVHVPPSARTLEEGDILTLDMGLKWKGWYLDMARTIPIGNIDEEKQRLLDVTREALDLGIEQARPGNRLGDIGYAVQEFVEGKGYNVVRELCGHGIGRELHEEPRVLNYGKAKTDKEIKEGWVIAIEPMVTQGDWKLVLAKDGHSLNTKDGSLFCHFEDTVAITEKGPEVLTR